MKTAVFVNTLVLLAIYKLVMFGFDRPLDFVANYVVEGLVTAVLWLVCIWLDSSPSRIWRAVSNGLFYTGIGVMFVANFLHTYFFGTAAERQVSLLEVNLGHLGFFFQTVLPLTGLLTLLAMLIAVGLTARALAPRLEGLSLTWPRRAVALQACVVGAWVLAGGPRVPSPTVDIVNDLQEVLLHERVTFDARTPLAGPLSVLDKSAPTPSSLATPFKRVVVVVFETTNERTLREETAQLPERSFLRKAGAHAHAYDRYYTSNQDSRTGMLGMLSSRFIPYDAYSEVGREHYMHLSQRSSLVKLFGSFGYATAFAVSQTVLELVVTEMPWDKKLNLSEAEANAAHAKFLCFRPYKFEHSCEDKVLLPKVVDFLSQHDRAFVYQEMIWGHAIEYNDASGKSNASYYSEYLDALTAALAERGLLDDTLIAVTADHGLRHKAMQVEPTIGQVPLFFYATRLGPMQNHGLYSHLDFKDLLLHELVPGSPDVPDNPFVFVVGPTGTSFRSVVTREGGFLLFKERGEARYLLRHEEPKASAPGSLPTPSAYLKLYDSYRDSFESSAVLSSKPPVLKKAEP